MQDTNLNVTPYFDDYQREKEFYRVLFKPGLPVQNRELSTLQSILQNQIERFGEHIFKDGSMVIPGQVAFDLNYYAVTVQPLVNGALVEDYRSALVGTKLTGSVSGVTAVVLSTISEQESEKGLITFYVKYVTAGNFDENGNQYTKFVDNENLLDKDLSVMASTTLTNSTAYTGCSAYIEQGVYFTRGFFLEVNAQSIILDQYSNFPSYKVGLKIKESIVTESDDESLRDISLGYPNFAAPGADRLKISAELTKVDLEEDQDKNFIELLRLRNGVVEYKIDKSVYAELGKNLARRTFEESGNYYVEEFKLNRKETLNNLFNNGAYDLNSSSRFSSKIVLNQSATSEDEINGNDYFTLEISPGKAYVKGYEVETVNQRYIDIPKARTLKEKTNESSLVSFGSYFELDAASLKGSLTSGTFQTLYFYDKPVGSTNSTIIGTAKYSSLVYGAKPKLYLIDFSTYTRLTIPSNIQFGALVHDVVVGQTSGAIGYVSANPVGNTIILHEVSGNFAVGESILNSRTTVSTTISTVTDYKTDQIRSVSGVEVSQFSANLNLESIPLSGSSFVVTNQINLGGVSSSFETELHQNTLLQFGNVTSNVSSITNDSTVILTSTVPEQSYTKIYKLVPILKTSGSKNYIVPQNQYVKDVSDFSYYVVKNYLVTFNNGTGILTTSNNESISGDVLIQTSIVSKTGYVGASNNIICNVANFSGNANVFVKVLVPSPILRQKALNTCQILKVNKIKNISNPNLNPFYGTRRDDVEISLAYPDVIRIHSIRQATSNNYTNQDLFDSVIVTNASNFNVGDIVYSNQNTAKAKIVSKTGNTLYLVYYTDTRFSSNSGSNEIKDFTTDAETTVTTVTNGTYIDITDNYTLDKNVNDETYNTSKLVRKLNYSAPQYDFVVVYDYYSHTSGDYFSIDSYPLNQVPYENLGSYNQDNIPDMIDFRITSSLDTVTITGNGSLNTPYIVNSQSLSKIRRNLINKNFAYPNTTALYDYQYYLGRIDTLIFDENGEFRLLSGSPSSTPSYPRVTDDSLQIASIVIPPYVTDVNDIYIQKYDNKRYTMSDIGLLDRRLSNVEYYTSLNLLELDTNSLIITDENGFNRFKNGFVVDPFKDFTVSDIFSVDFKTSIDVINGEARPSHYTTNVDLLFEESISTNFKKTGSLLTLDYENEVYVDQPFSSRSENVNPFSIFSWVGRIELTPASDNWVSTSRQADNIVRAEGNFERTARELGAGATGVTPTQWGAWTTISSTTTQNWWAITTTTNQRRTGNFSVLVEEFSNNDLGDRVLSSTTALFMRERTIGVKSFRLKPKSRMYLFINNINMTNYTIASLFEVYKGGENQTNGREFLIGETVRFSGTNITATVVAPSSTEFAENPYNSEVLPSTYTGTYNYLALNFPSLVDVSIPISSFSENATITGVTSGAVAKFKPKRIICDKNGLWSGLVIIPDPNINTNPRFPNGQSTFRLTTSPVDSRVPGIVETDAEVTFTSSGSTNVVQRNIISVRNARVENRTVTENRTTVTTQQIFWGDPLAQSFLVDREGGVFITKVDLYFQAKDENIPVNVDIRTMVNGYPTQTNVPFSSVSLNPNQVNLSDDATAVTTFTFPSPVYLQQDQEYSLVVWTNSDNYRVWISRLGETDVTTQRLISKNPYAGVLFKSQNASTWTADQFEDLKFKMYNAKFDIASSGELFFKNAPIQNYKLNKDPIIMTGETSIVTILHPNHGMHVNNSKVVISGVESEVPNTTLTSTLTNVQNTGPITITLTNAANFHTTIGNTPISTTNPGYMMIGDEIIAYSAIDGNNVVITPNGRGINSTSIVAHSVGEVVKCYNLNGIPLIDINKTHNSITPISLDSYSIQLNKDANVTLTAGGSSVLASRNIQFENITPNIAFMAVAGTELNARIDSFTSTSISSNSTVQPSYQTVTNENLSLNRITNFINPRMVASPINQFTHNNDQETLNLNIQMSSAIETISPVIDLDRLSLITTSNRINKLEDNSSSLLPSNTKNEANYITKVINTENSSTALRVLFEGVRFNRNDIRVYVKINRDDSLNFSENNYIEIQSINYPSSINFTDYKEFEYEIKNLPPFKSYVIKVEFSSDNQSIVPIIRKFRSIALAI